MGNKNYNSDSDTTISDRNWAVERRRFPYPSSSSASETTVSFGWGLFMPNDRVGSLKNMPM